VGKTPGPPLLRGSFRGGVGGGKGGGRGREGEKGGYVEGPGKLSAPGPALALGGPGQRDVWCAKFSRKTVPHPRTLDSDSY